MFKLLASTQYEIDIINISEIKNPFDYNCDMQGINIISSNKMDKTKTSDLDTGKNNVLKGSGLVNEESNLEIGAIITNYIISISELEKTQEQDTKNPETILKESLILKEMNKANAHESEKLIDKTELTNLRDPDKSYEQKMVNHNVKSKILSLPLLTKAIDLQKESAIRTLDTRSLHDDTYMTLQQTPGNIINNTFNFKREDFVLTATLHLQKICPFSQKYKIRIKPL